MIWRVAILLMLPFAMMAQTPTDTLKLTGRCEYFGRTYSITFVCYYRIAIDKVHDGEFTGNHIVVQADMDSGVRFLNSKVKKETEIQVDQAKKTELFGLEFVPISKVFKCRSKKFTIKVQKVVDEIRPDIVQYFMIPEPH